MLQHSLFDTVDTSIREDNKMRILSLFSGCGGMDLGFEGGFEVHQKSLTLVELDTLSPTDDWVVLPNTGFQTVFANDILTDASTAWQGYLGRRHASEHPIYHIGSIVDLVKRHLAGEGIFPSNIDVVTGGFPCQDFSPSGKRKGFSSHKDHHGRPIVSQANTTSHETRGMLYMWMKAVIEIVRPKMFIAENVKGLVNLSDVKRVIQNDFATTADNGYIVLEPRVLHAADFGVPQSRERVFFIGIKRSALKHSVLIQLEQNKLSQAIDPYPIPTHGAGRQRPWVTLADIFAHLEEPQSSQDPSQQYYSQAKFMGKHCQGQKEVSLGHIAPTIRSEHHGNIEYRRLSQEHGGQCFEELRRGLSERRLTPRECALIQTFPRDFPFVAHKPGSKHRFLLSPSGAYRVIGNAVPPLLAYRLAQRIKELWPIYFDA